MLQLQEESCHLRIRQDVESVGDFLQSAVIERIVSRDTTKTPLGILIFYVKNRAFKSISLLIIV